MKMYSPFPPLCTSRVEWVASLISVTVAAATMPPLGSLTVPRILPPVLCAAANGAASTIAAQRKSREKILRRQRIWLCQSPADLFMNSPLVSKNSTASGFFEVAVPPKPYYNPANLEKAGSRVKRKEFLQAISESIGASHDAHQRGGAPPGHLVFRAARVGSSRPRFSASHAEPLPVVRGSRRASPAARCFSAPRARAESRGDRPRLEAPGRSLDARGERVASWPAVPQTAHAPRSFSRASRPRHESFRRLSQRSRTRPDALFDFHAAPHRAFLSHQYSFSL